MSKKSNIKKLKKFNQLINDYFDGNYDDEKLLKTKINTLLPIVQDLILDAKCLKMMSMSPPPAIGGIPIENFNPFDMIFTDLWGRSIIPQLSDMIIQAISKYENNLVKLDKEQTKNNSYVKSYPEKITIKWLIDHVPIKIWVSFFSLLIASFLLGYSS